MRRKGVVTLALIAMLAFSVQVSLFVDSFYGFHGGAECSLCHNEPATAWNSTMADESIVVDGDRTDDMWDEHNTWGRTQYVPIAGRYGGGEFDDRRLNTIMLRITFGQNSTHFMMILDWEDTTAINGTTSLATTEGDGISIIFNIDSTDFASCFSNGMATVDGSADMVNWAAAPAAEGTELTNWNGYATVPVANGLAKADKVMDVVGIANDDVVGGTDDWTISAVYGNTSNHHEDSYQIEYVRPLVTDDENDVQFDETGYYEYAIALYDNEKGAGHTSSFAHAVWVYAGDVEPVTETVTETATETIETTKSEGGIFALFGLSLMVLIGSAVAVTVRRR